jgi:hypothetical protein
MLHVKVGSGLAFASLLVAAIACGSAGTAARADRDTASVPETTDAAAVAPANPAPVGPADATSSPQGHSGGSGGRLGSYRSSFSFGALSDQYTVDTPDSPRAPVGLLLFFHADGASVDAFDEQHDEFAELVTAKNFVQVWPRAPNPDGNWWESVDNFGYVDALVQSILGQYDVDLSRVYLAGVSGGSDLDMNFWQYTQVAHGRYGGGSIVLCGGFVPRLFYRDPQAMWTPPPPVAPDAVGQARFFFAVHRSDPNYPYAEDGADYVKGLGFAVRFFDIPDVDPVADAAIWPGHCSFNQPEYVARGIDWLDMRAAPEACRSEVACPVPGPDYHYWGPSLDASGCRTSCGVLLDPNDDPVNPDAGAGE